MKLSHVFKTLLTIAGALALAGGVATTPAAAAEGGPALDHAPIVMGDQESLQRGARAFSSYCLNCHALSYMRYSGLIDIGLSEEDIKQNLMFAADKVGAPMTIAMAPADAKVWFGNPPPDLSVEARVRGPDWLYTYLRGFYKDPARPTGWNNIAFPNVGMPHVLYELQGVQTLSEGKAEGAGEGHKTLVLSRPGKLSPAEYDRFTADLVNFLVYVAEPARAVRVRIGILVILFLVLASILAYLLKKEFWKDIH